MTQWMVDCAISWARVNRVDCNDDPCDDCTQWIGVI